VVVVAARCGRGPAILASLVGVLAFDYFIVPPPFGFVPEDATYLVTLVVMLAVALIVSALAAQLRLEADISRQRFRRMKTLYDFAADLARAVDRAAVMDAVQRHLRRVYQGSRAALLLPDRGGALRPAGAAPALALGERDLQAAAAATATGAVVDWSCARFGDIDGVHLPLRTGAANLGVLSLLAARGRFELDAERRHLEAFASQTALALERADLAVAAQQAELEAEEERMRNTLLRSVGHDLRTPLAAIQGAASALLENDALDAATKRELLQSIHDSCDRLSRQVHNLLQLTRLEAGSVPMSVEWTPLDEVVGAALTALEVRLAGRRVRVDLPDDLPPLPLDGLLAQHVVMNLVDNALSHTAADSPIDIVARRDAQHVVLEVGDRGPGIPAGEEERVFEKFYRLDRSRAGGGTGLGLAIARAIMHLHAGRIWVEARPGGGAAFRVAFPCTSASLPEDTAPRSEVPA
jgi:two-component system sensor histidine kinase KdpD